MAKAASQDTMNKLHDKIANIFIMVMDRYAARLDALETIDPQDMEDEMLKELFNEAALPSPAMLAAVTKFLKDNEVLFEKDVTEDVSATKKALEEKMRNRKNLAQLTLVPSVSVQ